MSVWGNENGPVLLEEFWSGLHPKIVSPYFCVRPGYGYEHNWEKNREKKRNVSFMWLKQIEMPSVSFWVLLTLFLIL